MHRVRFPREFWFNSGLAVLLLNCHPIRFGICVPVHTSLTKQQQLHRWKTFNFVIDPSEVDLRLANIKIHKAPGPHGIPNWLLRDFSGLLCQPLAAIFNASLREGFFPPIWKAAEVIPIPKVHPPTSIQNDLRPISLLPTAAKVLRHTWNRISTITNLAAAQKGPPRMPCINGWQHSTRKDPFDRCSSTSARHLTSLITISYSENFKILIFQIVC